jgi:hypothetical protein
MLRVWLAVILFVAACSVVPDFEDDTPAPDPTPTEEVMVGDPINPGFSLAGQPGTETIEGRIVQTPPRFGFYVKSGVLPPFSNRVQDGPDNDYKWELHNIPESAPPFGEWCYFEEGFGIEQGQRYIIVVEYDANLSSSALTSLTAMVWDTTPGESLQLQTDAISNGVDNANVWAFEVYTSDIPQLRYEVCIQSRFGMPEPAIFTWDSIEVRPVSQGYANDKVMRLE